MNGSDVKVTFDRGPSGAGDVFVAPSAIIRADKPDEVDVAFEAMQLAQSEGKWLAGYVSYEFGYLTSPKLKHLLPKDRALPLIHFGVFDGPQTSTPLLIDTLVELGPLEPQWDADRYAQAFETVHDYIGAGDIYQVNLTFPIMTCSDVSPDALYAKLCARQAVPHGAFVRFDETALLSRSPELFFSLTVAGKLTTRPMKGTAPRGATMVQDDIIKDALQSSEKNRAENLMIVDLLRNDMSRVSKIGSVKVPELFVVERFATLHQMTSCITSQILPNTTLKELFLALFPCGSITGAPKIRAMEVIHEIETQPREIYCGSIGWIAPTGAMEFNVAIRTLVYREDHSIQLNVGGGIIYDSTAKDEYDEALLKSRFAECS